MRGSRREGDNLDTIEAIIDEVTPRLVDLDQRWRSAGRSLGELGTAEDLADQMVRVLPGPSPWDSALGPFLSTSAVRARLGGISRQAVDDRRRRRTILALKTTDGVWLYPVFQFRRAKVIPGLVEVMACYPRGTDPWVIAGWLASTFEALDGHSPREVLETGGPLQPVLDLAAVAASRCIEEDR